MISESLVRVCLHKRRKASIVRGLNLRCRVNKQRVILPARVANRGVGFDSSRPLAEPIVSYSL